MPKDPKGEKHSDEVDVAAIQVGSITKGDKDVEASVATPAKSETSARRKEIDKAASSPRWEG